MKLCRVILRKYNNKNYYYIFKKQQIKQYRLSEREREREINYLERGYVPVERDSVQLSKLEPCDQRTSIPSLAFIL